MADPATLEFVPRIAEIAREAGALLNSYFARRIGFEYKGDADLVTEADRSAEKLIVEHIKQRLARARHRRRRGNAQVRGQRLSVGTSTRLTARRTSRTAILCFAFR